MFPEPGFTVMDSVLLFVSVSHAWIVLDTIFSYLACAGFVSDSHRDPRLRSEEPCRSLLDVLDWNAVRECDIDGLE